MTYFRIVQTERDCRRQLIKYDENGRKLSKRVENTVGKGEFARYEQFLLFPQCFQRNCTLQTRENKGSFWNGLIEPGFKLRKKKHSAYSTPGLYYTKIHYITTLFSGFVCKKKSPIFFLKSSWSETNASFVMMYVRSFGNILCYRFDLNAFALILSYFQF